jgi:hypothetical protein
MLLSALSFLLHMIPNPMNGLHIAICEHDFLLILHVRDGSPRVRIVKAFEKLVDLGFLDGFPNLLSLNIVTDVIEIVVPGGE